MQNVLPKTSRELGCFEIASLVAHVSRIGTELWEDGCESLSREFFFLWRSLVETKHGFGLLFHNIFFYLGIYLSPFTWEGRREGERGKGNKEEK